MLEQAHHQYSPSWFPPHSPKSMYRIDPHMLNKKAHMKDLD